MTERGPLDPWTEGSHEDAPGRRSGWRKRWVGAGLAVAAIVAGLTVVLTRPTSPSGTPRVGGAAFFSGDSRSSSAVDKALASSHGHPTLLWFIANSCSSCAASTPAVSKQLPQLASRGVRVVVADLYGDLPDTAQGRADLADFEHQFAGAAERSPVWTWGIASQALSYHWDPTGEPDLYFLIGADGRVRYVNSVPASTINDLMTQVSRV